MECEMSGLVGDDARRFRQLRRVLVGILVCRGLAYLCVLPLFEGWDEYEHVGYVVHVAETGRPAVPGQTNVPGSLLAELVKYPLPRCVVDLQLGRLGAVDYRTYWANPSSPVLRPGAMELYEAQHAWWYYRLVAPIFGALGGVAKLRWSVSVLRLGNLAFLAAALWVAYGVLARVARSPRDAAWAGLAIAVHPLFLVNGVRVANDALGVLLATLAIAGCLTLERRQGPWRWLAIGAAGGMAVLIKAVNLALVPFIALAWLGFVVRERPGLRAAAVGGMALGLGFLIVTQEDLRANYSRYGGPTPMQEAVVNRSRGRTTADLAQAAAGFRWDKQVRRLWLRDTFFAGGWSHVGPAPGWIQAYSYAVMAGLLGYVGSLIVPARRRALSFRSGETPLLCLVLCSSYTAAMAYHMVQSFVAWGKPTTCPWYACAALPWFLALAVGGARSCPVGLLRGAIPVGLAGTCLATEAVVVWGRMIPVYSGGSTGLFALRRLAFLQPPWLGTATLVLAEAGLVALLGSFFLVLRRVRPVDVGECSNHPMPRPRLRVTSPGQAAEPPSLARESGHRPG